MSRSTPSSPVGLHRVLEPVGVLPQAAERLDASPDAVAGRGVASSGVLNLDAASFRQLITKHEGDGDAVRAEVLEIVAERGKMQNPVTGSGGMLVGPSTRSARRRPSTSRSGQQVTTLVSLSLTPLADH